MTGAQDARPGPRELWAQAGGGTPACSAGHAGATARGRPTGRGRPPERDLLAEIGVAPVRFWTCPIREHGERNDDKGCPVVTVEWRGEVAHCTAPGCGRTSAARPPVTVPDEAVQAGVQWATDAEGGQQARPLAEQVRGVQEAGAPPILVAELGRLADRLRKLADGCIDLRYAGGLEDAAAMLRDRIAELFGLTGEALTDRPGEPQPTAKPLVHDRAEAARVALRATTRPEETPR